MKLRKFSGYGNDDTYYVNPDNVTVVAESAYGIVINTASGAFHVYGPIERVVDVLKGVLSE